MPVVADPQLGHYRIVSLIGSGATGEVYRARDTRLGREVALKVLTPEHSDEETLRRFETEARALSSLNHPNVVTVHDAGREGNRTFLVTELVQGEPLRKLLTDRGPLPLKRVLDYGLQIAEGIAAAHDEGIVHRDLKPENVLITRDGRVKVVDFGIAKVMAPGWGDLERTVGSNDTAPGLLLGTTAYMSPEQARGTRVSYATDQFALGLLLFEMASGEPAFRRDTPLATLSAILTDDPPELNTGSELFRWLVKRLLHKDPDHRYASVHDVVRELRNATATLTTDTQSGVEPTPVIASRRRVPWTALALAAVALASGFGAGWLVRDRAPSPGLATDFTPLVNEPGIQTMPAWSPNGRTLAWTGEDADGTLQIFVGSPGASLPVQLTSGSADAMQPFWSPDGRRLFYIADGSLWAVGATGGETELVLEGVVTAALARDGRTFALLRPEQEGVLCGLHVGPINELRTLEVVALPWSYLRFSPDGKRLGAWLSRPDGSSEFRLLDTASGSGARKLDQLPASPLARDFSWLSDGRRIVFSDGSGLSTGSHLVLANVEDGAITPLTTGTGSEFSPTVARNNRMVAFAATEVDYDIVHFGFDGSMSDVEASGRFELSPTVRAGAMAWISDLRGQPEIWFQPPKARWPEPLLAPDSFGEERTASLFDTELSPDGRRLAFGRAGADDESIWIASVGGDAPVRLGAEPDSAFQRGPTWSPDGNEIAYFSVRAGKYVLMRTRPGSADPPSVIAEDAGVYPRWSPRGELIAAIGPGEGVTLIAPDGSGRRTLGSGSWLVHGWSRDGSLLFGIRRVERTLQIARINVATRRESVVAELGRYPAAFVYGASLGMLPYRGWSYAPDGRGFLTSALRIDSDIWQLER